MARQAWGILLAATLGVAACRQEPTFEERYDAAQDEVEETARSIDRDLENDTAIPAPSTTSPAEEAGAVPAETPRR